MRFLDTPLSGAKLVELEPHRDERGLFVRLHCEREFEHAGLVGRMVQTSLSVTVGRGLVRGMHFQGAPSSEAKLVRCIAGAVFDVIIDLRSSSATFCRYFSVELNEQSRLALFIPPGFAHGFQTLEERAEVLYQMTDFYEPALGRGLRWNDPTFRIPWPLFPATLNDRDRSYPDFSPALVEGL